MLSSSFLSGYQIKPPKWSWKSVIMKVCWIRAKFPPSCDARIFQQPSQVRSCLNIKVNLEKLTTERWSKETSRSWCFLDFYDEPEKHSKENQVKYKKSSMLPYIDFTKDATLPYKNNCVKLYSLIRILHKHILLTQ